MKTFTITAALLAVAKAGTITDERIRSPAEITPIGFEDAVLPLSRAVTFIDRSTDLPSTALKSDVHLPFLDKVQELSPPDIYTPEVAAEVSENISQKANESASFDTTTADSELHNVSAVERVLLENFKVGETVPKPETVADASTANLDETSSTTVTPAINTTTKEDSEDIRVPFMLVKSHQPDTPRIVLTLEDLHEAEKLAENKSDQAEAPLVKASYQIPAIIRITDALNESRLRGNVQEIPLREGMKYEVPSIVNNYFYNVFMSLLGASPYGRVVPMLPVSSTRPSRSVPVLLDLKSALAGNCSGHKD